MSKGDVIKNSMLDEYPIVIEFKFEILTAILNHFQKIKLLATENRAEFSVEFPTHTRYFSNVIDLL